MKNLRKWLLCVIAAVSLTVTACEGDAAANASVAADVAHAAGNILGSLAEAAENSGAGNSSGQGNKTSMGMAGNPSATGEFRLSDIPEYTDSPYVAVNGNVPYFTEDDLTDVSFERYSDLDSLGRCGVAYASVSTDTMPTEKRGSIGEVKPTGWINAKYDFVDGKYLYNRCHLIGYQLTAENANEKNLITGTRYLNVQGMLPFENLTADYVKETGNHVMYRVTPVFEGDNLVASGVLMEAESVEDEGDGVLFTMFSRESRSTMRRERVNWRRAEVQEAVKAEVRQVPGKRQVHRLLETIHQGHLEVPEKTMQEPLEKRAEPISSTRRP